MYLSKEDFNKLEKSIVIKGENWNNDRCLVVPVIINNKAIDVTICMDEIECEARICQIDGEDVIADDELLIRRVLNQLKEESTETEYSEDENEKYNYYLEEIKMNTECCDMNCSKCRYYSEY